ncbi:putative transcriptional regulatory protein [Xylaria sp. FL1042]|nr:putative transcriptional regulatory protein [Xylaria sp. FL1042]
MTPGSAGSHQAPKRRKVAESCKLCRAKKTRCDGQHPACSSCTAKGLECEYNIATVPVSNSTLENIESRLQKLEQQVNGTSAPNLRPEHSANGSSPPGPGGNPEAESSAFFRDNPTARFMRDITQIADAQSRGQLSHESLWEQNDSLPVETDPLSMVVPERATSDVLLDSYEQLVYPLFPILHMPTFRSCYEHLWESPPRDRFKTPAEEVVFHATLNIVFALGCINDSITESHLKMRTADCFYRRARRILSLDALDHLSLGVAQYLLLTSTYFSYTKYASRCCNTLAVAIRVCLSLNLQADVDSCSSNQLNREMSRRVWHICLTLERLFTSVFGHKTLVGVDSAVPLPSSIDDEYLSEQGVGTQPVGTPSIIEATVITINILRVVEDAQKLKYQSADQDINNLHELTQVLRLNSEIDGIERGLPSYLKAGTIETPATPRDQVLRLQAEGVMTRILYARLDLLRPYVLSAARQSLRNSDGEDSLTQPPSSLHSTIRTEITKICVQAAISAISTLHTNLRFKRRIFSCNAVFMTLTATTVLIAASLVSGLDVNLDDVGPNEAALAQAFKVLDEHMWQIEGGKRLRERLARFLEIVRRKNKRQLSDDNGQDSNIDSLIEEFDFNDPIWTFQ